MIGSLNVTLSQTWCWVCQWKNFENWSVIDTVIQLLLLFLDCGVHICGKKEKLLWVFTSVVLVVRESKPVGSLQTWIYVLATVNPWCQGWLTGSLTDKLSTIYCHLISHRSNKRQWIQSNLLAAARLSVDLTLCNSKYLYLAPQWVRQPQRRQVLLLRTVLPSNVFSLHCLSSRTFHCQHR